MPKVNFNSCSGKGDCITVCPYNVFEIQVINPEDRKNLNIKGKIKTLFFKQKAYVINPEECHSCGLCVTACPENAIKLSKYSSSL